MSSLTLKLDLHSRNAWPSLSAGGSNLKKRCIGSRTEHSTIDRGCFLSLLAVALEEQRDNRCFKAPWAGRNLILGVLDVCIYRGKIPTVVSPFFFGSYSIFSLLLIQFSPVVCGFLVVVFPFFSFYIHS